MAIEATTLASAPMITHQRTSRSLEAAWKYLLICSVASRSRWSQYGARRFDCVHPATYTFR
jgi:hypothetical protein